MPGKKQGKERLDKYYHLAKQQGYRARSAFKLLQLNRKYHFLDRAKVLVDLCAAPGGWLQVASKSMPVDSIIVGVDLAPIRPIPRVITHQADITTDKCRSLLRQDLKDWKADVILNDGAPNVGTAWLHDAYAQAELVLASLKLATEWLRPGGTFVTKVFRSKDYNNLMWVLQQLFKNVEATKPPSSRNVSAEIFVVCQNYLAPKKIDPRFLDPKHVFKDIAEEDVAAQKAAVLKDLLNPEKTSKRRHRDGYEDGDYTLHHAKSVLEFIGAKSESAAIQLLADSHVLTWTTEIDSALLPDTLTTSEILEIVRQHPLTTDEIKSCCADLKVLGRRDYKLLLKWRTHLRTLLWKKEKKDESEQEKKSDDQEEEIEKSPENVVNELTELENVAATEAKRKKRKRLERLAKDRRRMQLNMVSPTDIGMDIDNGNILDDDMALDDGEGVAGSKLFDLRQISREKELYEEGYVSEESIDGQLIVSDDEVLDSDEELAKKADDLAEGVDNMYDDYLSRKLSKNPKLLVQQKRMEEEEFHGISDIDKDSSDDENSNDGDKSSESDFLSSENDQVSESEEEELSGKAKLWLSQPIFQDILDEPEAEVAKSNSRAVESEDELDIKEMKRAAKKQKTELTTESFDDEDIQVEPTTAAPEKDFLDTPELMTLAMKMVQDGGRQARDAIDDFGYNRHTFNDPDGSLPRWFIDDERQHSRPQKPVTKEAMALLRAKQKELNSRPIKKVMEAKARKKMKAVRKIEGLRQKMNALYEDGEGDLAHDPEQNAKLGQINKTMQNALRKAKKMDRKRPELVVARGGNRGRQGRPKGVKGRYKMVDKRLKKDARSDAAKLNKAEKPRSK